MEHIATPELTRDGDCLVLRVVETVAAAEDVTPTDLEPLYDALEPEIFDVLSAGDRSATPLQFSYEGHKIRVDDGGQVDIV